MSKIIKNVPNGDIFAILAKLLPNYVYTYLFSILCYSKYLKYSYKCYTNHEHKFDIHNIAKFLNLRLKYRLICEKFLRISKINVFNVIFLSNMCNQTIESIGWLIFFQVTTKTFLAGYI